MCKRVKPLRPLQHLEYAQIFVDNVFWLHGLPKVIISDRDPHFTCKFWHVLFDLLGTDFRFSIAFHPEIYV